MQKLLSPTLPKTASEEDKIFAAVPDITGKHVVSVAEEAKVFSVKFFSGELDTICKDVVNEFVGSNSVYSV